MSQHGGDHEPVPAKHDRHSHGTRRDEKAVPSTRECHENARSDRVYLLDNQGFRVGLAGGNKERPELLATEWFLNQFGHGGLSHVWDMAYMPHEEASLTMEDQAEADLIGEDIATVGVEWQSGADLAQAWNDIL